jgi:hypothetical protein
MVICSFDLTCMTLWLERTGGFTRVRGLRQDTMDQANNKTFSIGPGFVASHSWPRVLRLLDQGYK